MVKDTQIHISCVQGRFKLIPQQTISLWYDYENIRSKIRIDRIKKICSFFYSYLGTDVSRKKNGNIFHSVNSLLDLNSHGFWNVPC